jgi:hypothetical protein
MTPERQRRYNYFRMFHPSWSKVEIEQYIEQYIDEQDAMYPAKGQKLRKYLHDNDKRPN